jgi:hypothetical protein
MLGLSLPLILSGDMEQLGLGRPVALADDQLWRHVLGEHLVRLGDFDEHSHPQAAGEELVENEGSQVKGEG